MIVERQKAALEAVERQLDELSRLFESTNKQDLRAGRERLIRWKERTADILEASVHPEEASKLRDKKPGLKLTWGEPLRDFHDEVALYRSFLTALQEELQARPQHVLVRPEAGSNAQDLHGVTKPSVFIVHGHDELNLWRLKDIIRERWGLPVLVLSGKPGKGRTLIEKFEEEAAAATFAFVLLTPDDTVTTANGGYAQARPNVVFELGWFYGRLGRRRVCLLFKSGTHIHSDLDGVSRIEFEEAVTEKLDEIERELLAAELLQHP
jgi:predicted nucleotide-binding protein